MLATVVYLLCAVTSAACAALLLAARRRVPEALLSSAAACFCLLAANNAVLALDSLVLGDALDLRPLRAALALAGFLVLLAGLILDTTRRPSP